MKEWVRYLITFLIIGLVYAGLLFVFTGCKTFEPIWVKQLPAECNMTLNTYRLYYNSNDKSAVIPSSDYCYKKLHRMYCQAEVFGENDKGQLNSVEYEDAKKYRNYTQCLAELQ